MDHQYRVLVVNKAMDGAPSHSQNARGTGAQRRDMGRCLQIAQNEL